MFTAPELVADALAAVGEKLEERLTLLPLETTYRAQFADGSHLDVHADPDAFAAEVERLCGPGEALALRRYLAGLAELYRLQLTTFIDRNLDSPLDLLGPELIALARRGGFGRLSRYVERSFADDRLRRLFSFQALYAGVSPTVPSPPMPWSPSSTSVPASGTPSAGSPPFRARSRMPADAGVGSATGRTPSSRSTVPASPPSDLRMANGWPPTPSSSPVTSRGGSCRACGHPAGRCGRRPAGHPPRRAGGAPRAGAPHHQLRRVVARRLRRAHPRAAP